MVGSLISEGDVGNDGMYDEEKNGIGNVLCPFILRVSHTVLYGCVRCELFKDDDNMA